MKFKNISIDRIVIEKNIRSDVDGELGGLIESIEKYDLLQPILVIPKGDKYELVTGHRRFEAVKSRGEPFIPCIIRDDLSRGDLPFIKLVENVQRKQMSPCELVNLFETMMKEIPGLSKRGIARMLGKSDTWVYDKYKANKIYVSLLDSGLSEEAINDLSETDLKQISHIVDSDERADVVRSRGARRPRDAGSYIKDKRGPYTDFTGGFNILKRGHSNVLVVCENNDIRNEIMKLLLQFKIEKIEAGS